MVLIEDTNFERANISVDVMLESLVVISNGVQEPIHRSGVRFLVGLLIFDHVCLTTAQVQELQHVSHHRLRYATVTFMHSLLAATCTRLVEIR